MQIRTAAAIGTRIAIGTFIGMGVSEKTKIRILTAFKKKLIFALTGEEWTPKKQESVPHHVSYSDFTKPIKEEIVVPADLLEFETEGDAKDILSWVTDMLNNHGVLSVLELGEKRKKTMDYTWDHYGWRCGDTEDAIVWRRKYPHLNDDKWIISLPKPRFLD